MLDEPTASLDLAHQHAVLGLMHDLARQQNIGVLAVLHDLNLAARYADQLVLLKQGRVIGSGAPATVLTAERISECFSIETVITRHPTRDCPLIVAA